MRISNAGDASPTLKKLLPNFIHLKNHPFLDAPCGNGRNAFLLAKLGAEIVCVDIDANKFDLIKNHQSNSHSNQNLKLHCFDLLSADLPCVLGTFGVIVNVHFCSLKLTTKLSSLLIPGGLLYLETCENRGGNYLELEEQNAYQNLLRTNFEFLYLKETSAGPSGCNRTVIKLLAKKML